MQLKLLGIQGATNIDLVSAATVKLSGAELTAALSTTNLTEEEQRRILIQHGLSGTELETTMQTLAHSAANTTATATTGALTTATGGLSAAFRGLTVAMASNPIGAIAVGLTALIGVISTVITLTSNYQQTIKDVSESAKELTDNFDKENEKISDNINTLQKLKPEFEQLSEGVSDYGENVSLTADEYDRYKEIVQTILGISPSLVEGYDKEGNALANKNGLLEKSIALMEEKQRLEKEKLTREDNLNTLLNSGKEDVNSAKDDVNNIKKPNSISYSTKINGKSDGLFDILFNGGKFNGERGGFSSPTEKYIEHIIGVEKEVWESESDYILRNYEEIYKHIDEIIADSQKNFTDDTGEYIGFTDTQAETFRNYLLKFKDYIDKEDEVNSEFNSYLKLIPESMKEYSDLNDSSKTFLSEWIEKNFNIDNNTTEKDIKIFSSKIRQFVKEVANNKDLQDLFDFGSELTTDKDNNNLSVENYQNKVKDFINKVNEIDDEDTKLYIKTVFDFEENDDDLAKDIEDKIKRVKNILKDEDDDKVSGLTMQELNIAYNISASEGSLTFDELKKKIKETQKQATESSFALSDDQTKELKSIYSDVDKLNKAYQDLFAGKITTNDVAELVDLFPTLGEYVDWTDEKFGNLAEGIDKVIKERPADLINQLESQLESIDTTGMSEQGRKSIESVITALKQLKPELKDTKTLIEDIQAAIKGVSSSISTLIGFTKEISSDGALSLSSIDTILTDDTYKSLRPYINDMDSMKTAIEELVATQKDAYEDLYNAEIYENDYESYHKAVQEKEKDNENLLSDSIKQIQDEINYFSDAYGIDITNWDNLTDTKKNILQNTNAELLSKQNKLINEFANSYGVDLTNFAKVADAKAAILENLGKSQAMQNVTDYLNSQSNLGADWYAHTPVSVIPQNVQSQVASYLSAVGMTFEDWQDYIRNGTLSSAAGNAIQKSIEGIIKGFTITDTDWEKMTANIKGTGGSNSSSSTKNYIDWIERRLKKFAQTTKEVFAKVADYISFNNQNSQLRKAINAIRDEIAVNEQSYRYYMEEANKVGLDPYWQWFVQNGARNISDIQDEQLREKISRYKELYDNAINCKNAVEDLRKTEKEYASQMLSNVEKYYSNRITYANADADYYNSLDTDNQYINKNFDAIRKSYKSQISYTQSEHDNLLNTLNSLVSNGSIKYQSDEWYEWWEKIQKCNVEVRNLKKSIHDLANEELQNIQGFWDNRISAYDNTISYINTVSGDTTRKGTKNYNSLSSAYNSQISYTNKQISELQTRLNKAIKSGDIEKYSDKWYEWTGIIEQGKGKVAELQASIHQLAVEQFNDISTKNDNLLNSIEHQSSLIEESINQIEEKGYIASIKYYNALIDNERNNISQLSAKRNELYSNLQQAIKSGSIQESSEEWHKMVQEINSVDLEIEKANTSLIKFNNSIRDIQWQIFDLLQDKISQITQESNFLVNLMKNDNLYIKEGQGAGQLTNKGLSTMGLHGVNYNVYMAQSSKYAEEILKIDKQLAKDPYNQDLIKRREELLKLQQDMIASANDEKQAIVSMVKEGIDLELNALKELIDKYNDALDSAKNLYDYQNNISDKTSEIASLRKQLLAYSGDTSEETKATIQKLQVSLSDAEKDLKETEYDKYISDQKELLNDLYDEYETIVNQRLDNVDSLISDMITNINDNASTIKQTLIDEAGDVGYQISSTMNNIWNNGTIPVLSEYNQNFLNASNNVVTAINSLTVSINNMIANLDKTASTTESVKSVTKKPTVTVKNPSTTNKTSTSSNTNKSNTTTSTNKNSNTNNKSNASNNKSNTNKSNTSSTNKSNTSKSNTNNISTNKVKRTDKENYGVALAIWNGNYGWGNGSTRTKRLTAKGFDASKIQSIVNKMGKDGYVYSDTWSGKYYGIKDLSSYHYNKFKQGTHSVNRNQMAWTNENGNPEVIIRRSDGAILTPLVRDDMILNGNATNNLFNMATDPNTFIKDNLFNNNQNTNAPNISNVNNNYSVSVDTVNFNLPNVKNYEEFFYAAQHDKRFEKMVQAMTVDKLFGGSSLKKYNV